MSKIYLSEACMRFGNHKHYHRLLGDKVMWTHKRGVRQQIEHLVYGWVTEDLCLIYNSLFPLCFFSNASDFMLVFFLGFSDKVCAFWFVSHLFQKESIPKKSTLKSITIWEVLQQLKSVVRILFIRKNRGLFLNPLHYCLRKYLVGVSPSRRYWQIPLLRKVNVQSLCAADTISCLISEFPTDRKTELRA